MAFYSVVGGNKYFQSATLPAEIIEHLPVGTYTLKKTSVGEFFYEAIDSYTLPSKVYGDLTKNRDRILNTFMDRPAGTGVMLAGEKGSGKTLLSKAISIEAAQRFGIPTIVINTPYCGDSFNSFVQEMHEPCIFVFDEFEKVYDRDAQESLLTLLDGVYPTKKLFLITTNDKWKIDIHMRNRPGRIFYLLDFKGLDKEFVREYAADNLKNQKYLNSVIVVSTLFSEFNFDMLKALVEEMNRYDEGAHDAMRMLNAKPEFSSNREYEVELIINGEVIPDTRMPYGKTWSGNPINSEVDFTYLALAEKQPKAKGAEPAFEYISVEFDPDDITSVENGEFRFDNEDDGIVMILRKYEPIKFNVLDRMAI